MHDGRTVKPGQPSYRNAKTHLKSLMGECLLLFLRTNFHSNCKTYWSFHFDQDTSIFFTGTWSTHLIYKLNNMCKNKCLYHIVPNLRPLSYYPHPLIFPVWFSKSFNFLSLFSRKKLNKIIKL